MKVQDELIAKEMKGRSKQALVEDVILNLRVGRLWPTRQNTNFCRLNRQSLGIVAVLAKAYLRGKGGKR